MKRIESKIRDDFVEAIREINRAAPHQQDQLNWYLSCARTLATSTHGASGHLTKTVILRSRKCK